MSAETVGVERALGAIGTTFRLMRLYPPTHPAVVETLRQIGEALPALAALGTVEWKVGVTGLHWHGQHLLPRNAQIAELAGLLYARGVRAATLNPGMVPEHVLALFQVANGTVPPDDGTLGRITLTLGRRTSARLEKLRTPTPTSGAPAIPEPSAESSPPTAVTTEQSTAAAADTLMAGKRGSSAFRPDVLPVDVEVKRAVAALGSATTPEEQSAAVDKLAAIAPQLLGLHDVAVVAEAIAALDRLLPTAKDPKLTEAIDRAALALSERTLVERLVHRLGGPRVPPEQREALVAAVGALASLSMGRVLAAFLAAPVDLRAPFRGAVRKAADRALEPLQGKLADKDAQVVAAAAEFVGLTGSPQAVTLLIPLLRHPSEFVREATLLGLAEAGGREIARPAMPALKDESVAVRAAAVRAVAAAGDSTSSTVLIRRVEQEPDEGVQAELLRAIGRLGARDALDVLARYAEPGGMMHRRSITVRAAAVDGLRHIARPEARGLLELYSKDKEPAVRKAAKTGDAVLSQAIAREVAKRVVAQDLMVERLLIGLLTGGHVLLEGVPGLAKTLAVRTVAECLRIAFSRIQFTPDLLPADVIGTMVFDQKTQEFYPKKGPLFANLVLADEINRAPAKVQAALLEAMQEKQVTIGGETFFLGEPFLVLATQNPIEQEGTYPLPEAQLDRFMLKVRVGYPTRDAEKEIVSRMASGRPIEVARVADADAILAARSAIAELFMDQKVVDYIVDVVRGTREPQAVGLAELKPVIAFGASPRASINLAQAARAHAYLRGRNYVVPEDVQAMAFDVLRHRVLLTFEAAAEDMDSDRVIGKILEAVGVP